MDADTIVNDELHELFEEELSRQGFDIAAAPDPNFPTAKRGERVMSGLLLLNLSYQRKNNFNFINDDDVIFEYPDQDAISRARKTIIPISYMYMQPYYGKSKVMNIYYRNSGAVRTFLKQSVYRLDAQKLYRGIDRIAKLVSDIQKPCLHA